MSSLWVVGAEGESEGTYCPAGCWCAGCLWWLCSPAETEQHPQSQLFLIRRPYRTVRHMRYKTYCRWERERESECQGQIPTTHKLQTGKRQWTMTWLLCLTKTWSIFKACFWQTQGHCFMRSLCLTESSSEPWVLCERRIIKSAVRQNQVCSIYKTGSSSTCKKLHGKVNEVIVLLIFYLKSTGVHVKYKVL